MTIQLTQNASSEKQGNAAPARPASKAVSYNDTFERTEAKYLLSSAQYAALMELIHENLEPDAYPLTRVTSLYFDTPDNTLIERSLEKPVYKEKLRARVYRSIDAEGHEAALPKQAFVEIKKKFKGTVYKRRVGLSLQAAQMFLEGTPYETAVMSNPLSGDAASQALSTKGCQVAREIQSFFQRYPGLQPAMFTDCVRTSWHDANSQLRVTFDADIRACRATANPYEFQVPAHAMNLLDEGQVLMEIKQVGALPTWLIQALSSLKIFPQSFSKYGTAYLKEVQATRMAASKKRSSSDGARRTARNVHSGSFLKESPYRAAMIAAPERKAQYA